MSEFVWDVRHVHWDAFRKKGDVLRSEEFACMGIPGFVISFYPKGHAAAQPAQASVFVHGPQGVLVEGALAVDDASRAFDSPEPLVDLFGFSDFMPSRPSYHRITMRASQVQHGFHWNTHKISSREGNRKGQGIESPTFTAFGLKGLFLVFYPRGTVQSADGQAAVCLCGPTGVRAKFTVRVSGKADGLHSDDDVPETEAQTCVSQRCTDEEPLFVACGSALPGPGWLNFMPVQAYYNHVRVVVHNVHLVSCFHWDLSSIDWSLYSRPGDKVESDTFTCLGLPGLRLNLCPQGDQVSSGTQSTAYLAGPPGVSVDYVLSIDDHSLLVQNHHLGEETGSRELISIQDDSSCTIEVLEWRQGHEWIVDHSRLSQNTLRSEVVAAERRQHLAGASSSSTHLTHHPPDAWSGGGVMGQIYGPPRAKHLRSSVHSPVFSCGGLQGLKLVLYPNGRSDSSPGQVGLFLDAAEGMHDEVAQQVKSIHGFLRLTVEGFSRTLRQPLSQAWARQKGEHVGFADFCDKELLHEAHESLKVGMELIGQSPTLLSQWHSEQRLWHFLAGMESGHDSPASKLPQCLRQYDAFVGQQNHASIAPDLSGSRGVGNGADDDHLQAAVHTNTLTAALCDWDVLSSNMEEHEDETKERQHQLEQQQWRLTQQECRIILQELQGVQLLVSADYRDYFENLNALLRERDELQERLQGAQLEQAKSQEELKTLRQGQEDLEQRLKEALAKQKNARDEHGQQMLELQAVCHENAMLKVAAEELSTTSEKLEALGKAEHQDRCRLENELEAAKSDLAAATRELQELTRTNQELDSLAREQIQQIAVLSKESSAARELEERIALLQAESAQQLEQIASLSRESSAARELEERIALLQAQSAQQLADQGEMWAELQANADLHAAILQERDVDSALLQALSTELQDLARVVDVLRQEALAKDATTREHASGAQDRAEDAATEAEVEAAAGVSGEVETAVVHDVAHVSACSSSTLATILEVDQEHSTDTDTPPAPLRVDESSDPGKEQKPELSGENEEVAAQSNTKSDDSTMPEKNTVIEHQQQEAPKAGSLQIELVLDMEMSEIEGSEKTFELAVLRDVALAILGDVTKIECVRLEPGSIVVHLVLYQGVCGNEQTLEQVARELEMQVDDAGSALRQGIFTSKATAVCVTDILLDSGVQELADADSTLTTDTLDAARLQPYANSPLKIGVLALKSRALGVVNVSESPRRMLLELSSISKDANGSADRSIDRAGIGCDRLSDMGSPRRPEVARVDLRDNHGLQSEVLHKNAAEEHVAKSLGAPEVLHKDAEEGCATKDWFQESAAERRERDSEREERARLMAERDKLADLVDTKNLGSQALAEGADEKTSDRKADAACQATTIEAPADKADKAATDETQAWPEELEQARQELQQARQRIAQLEHEHDCAYASLQGSEHAAQLQVAEQQSALQLSTEKIQQLQQEREAGAMREEALKMDLLACRESISRASGLWSKEEHGKQAIIHQLVEIANQHAVVRQELEELEDELKLEQTNLKGAAQQQQRREEVLNINDTPKHKTQRETLLALLQELEDQQAETKTLQTQLQRLNGLQQLQLLERLPKLLQHLVAELEVLRSHMSAFGSFPQSDAMDELTAEKEMAALKEQFAQKCAKERQEHEALKIEHKALQVEHEALEDELRREAAESKLEQQSLAEALHQSELLCAQWQLQCQSDKDTLIQELREELLEVNADSRARSQALEEALALERDRTRQLGLAAALTGPPSPPLVRQPWSAEWSQSKQRYYFLNQETRETRWTLPAALCHTSSV